MVDTWYLYIIQSQKTKALYTGVSNDPKKRLKKHNSGKGAKYTRGDNTWEIQYIEAVGLMGEALKRERQVKKLTRAKKLAMIQEMMGSSISI